MTFRPNPRQNGTSIFPFCCPPPPPQVGDPKPQHFACGCPGQKGLQDRRRQAAADMWGRRFPERPWPPESTHSPAPLPPTAHMTSVSGAWARVLAGLPNPNAGALCIVLNAGGGLKMGCKVGGGNFPVLCAPEGGGGGADHVDWLGIARSLYGT